MANRGNDSKPNGWNTDRRWKRLMALVRRTLILPRTAVGTRRGRLDWLGGHGLLEGAIDVIRRARNVAQVGRRAVVDGAIVDHHALRVDNDHLRRRLRVVKMADLPGRVEQRGGRRGLHLRQVVILFARGHIPLFARRRRYDREPDDAAGGPLL